MFVISQIQPAVLIVTILSCKIFMLFLFFRFQFPARQSGQMRNSDGFNFSRGFVIKNCARIKLR